MMDGKRLEQMVGGRGKELERFASHVGASVTGAKKWFSGTQPSVGFFVGIANYFHMSLDELAAELGLIERTSAPGAMPPEVVAAIRRALDRGVPAGTICQVLDAATLGYAAGRPKNEAAATEPPAKKGRVV